MPASRAAPRSVSWKNPPYAASTCSHSPSAAATSASACSGSTVPVLVVPALATTQNGMPAGCPVGRDRGPERGEVHAQVRVDRHHPHRVRREARQPGGLGDGQVRLSR